MFDNKNNAATVTGSLLLFAGVVIIGSILSAAYLWASPFVSSLSVNLSVVLAVLLGAAIGVAAGYLIKFLGITSPVLALTVILAGCICFTYFKWALYTARDAEKYGYDYESIMYFSILEDYFIDANLNVYSDGELAEIIANLQQTSAYDYFGGEEWEKYLKEIGVNVDQSDLDFYKSVSCYELEGFDQDFGVDIPKAVEEIKNYLDYSIFCYYVDLRILNAGGTQTQETTDESEESEQADEESEGDGYKKLTATYYMGNPGRMFTVIAKIYNEGRWTLDEEAVKGFRLGLVWLGEFLLICAPAVYVAIRKARPPLPELVNISGSKSLSNAGTAEPPALNLGGTPTQDYPTASGATPLTESLQNPGGTASPQELSTSEGLSQRAGGDGVSLGLPDDWSSLSLPNTDDGTHGISSDMYDPDTADDFVLYVEEIPENTEGGDNKNATENDDDVSFDDLLGKSTDEPDNGDDDRKETLESDDNVSFDDLLGKSTDYSDNVDGDKKETLESDDNVSFDDLLGKSTDDSETQVADKKEPLENDDDVSFDDLLGKSTDDETEIDDEDDIAKDDGSNFDNLLL